MASKYSKGDKKLYSDLSNIKWPSHWSYSSNNIFSKCRRRYLYQYLFKLPQPKDNVHLVRGNKVHKAGEDFLDDVTKRVPAAFKQFADEMKAIKKLGAIAEGSFAFTKSWQKTSPTDWANAWLRVKIDAIVPPEDGTLTVIDFKTGKPYSDTQDQSELYAVAAFQLQKNGDIAFDDFDSIDVEFWYVDSGEVTPYHYNKKEFSKLKKFWFAKSVEQLKARQFPATKNQYDCKFCPFKDTAIMGNGMKGPCAEHKKAK